MNEARAAVRYAKAILDLGVENKAIDQVEKDFRKIVATIADSPELEEMLGSPVLKGEVKKKAYQIGNKKSGKLQGFHVPICIIEGIKNEKEK